MGLGAAGAGAPASVGIGGAGAAAGAAGGLFGIPLSIALPILISILGGSGIFGGKKDPNEQAMEDALALKQRMGVLDIPKGYQSPYLPAIDQATFKAIMNQMQRTANWGWPEGQQQDMSWITDLLQQYAPAGGGAPSLRGRVRR